MATENQIAANRRNACKSTGPRTEEGKRRSRQNAFRHGLTSETVIFGLEEADSYAEFQQAIIADYEPITVIEYQLVIRLSSLLWRLRRAIAIESGLFQVHCHARGRPKNDREQEISLKMLHRLLDRPRGQPAANNDLENTGHSPPMASQTSSQRLDLTYSYLQLANLDNDVLERISRYEASLWRQAAQTLLLLQTFRKGLAQTIREGGY